MGSARRRIDAVRFLGALFGGEPPAAPGVRRGRRWPSDPDRWDSILAVAGELRVSPALWPSLAPRSRELPSAVVEAARREHLANTGRNLRLRRELEDALVALNDAGIVPMLFKGSAWLVARGRLAPGERWMVDLDLAIPAGTEQVAVSALSGLGYVAEPGRPFLHPHELPLVRPGACGPIELHVELGSPPVPAVLPAREAWAASSEVSLGSGRARVLSPSHEVIHSVLHSAVQDLHDAAGGLPLRQLLTLAELAHVHGSSIDWPLVARRFDAHGLGRTLQSHLWLAHRYAGLALPGGIRPGRRAVWHELRVLVSFGLGWPAQLIRNVRFAFGRDYLDSLYHHANRPLPLAVARVRHGVRLVRRDHHRVIREAVVSRE